MSVFAPIVCGFHTLLLRPDCKVRTDHDRTAAPARHHPGILPARDGFGNRQKSARFFEKNKNEISTRKWEVGGYQKYLQPNFEKNFFEISN
jgi:hypothetical protein